MSEILGSRQTREVLCLYYNDELSGGGCSPPGNTTRPHPSSLEPNACAAMVAEELECENLDDPEVRAKVIAALPKGALEKLEAGEDFGVRCGVRDGDDQICGIDVYLTYRDGLNGPQIEIVDSSPLADCPQIQ